MSLFDKIVKNASEIKETEAMYWMYVEGDYPNTPETNSLIKKTKEKLFSLIEEQKNLKIQLS
jgi:hypothetical protein